MIDLNFQKDDIAVIFCDSLPTCKGITFKAEDGEIVATWTDGDDGTMTHTKRFSPYGYLAESINAFFKDVNVHQFRDADEDEEDEDEDKGLPF